MPRETPNVSAICCTVYDFASYMVRACFAFVGVILNRPPPLRPRARAAASPSCVRSTMRSCGGWVAEGTIGAAALFTHFLPQLGSLVPEMGELLVAYGAEIADALVGVSSLTPGVRPCCVAFNDRGR